VSYLLFRLLQAYITTLTIDQCHKLILKAYGQVGVISLAKALVEEEEGPSEPPATITTAHHGASVVGVEQCLHLWRMSPVKATHVLPH